MADTNRREIMEHAPTIADEQALIAEDFELFDDWREKIEYVLDLGKRLAPLPEADYAEHNKVKGCQSQVWMIAELDRATGEMRIRADSDAFIVKGLIALLLRLYSNRKPQDILENPPEVFEQIGLGAHLSPTRANGLHAMIKRIHQLATACVHGAPAVAAAG
jgi:cysteine desulfuration protein SufE